MEEVVSFLKKIGLPEYQQLFEEQAITLDILKEFVHDDLDAIGIKKYGHRHVILREAKQLGIPVKEYYAPIYKEPPKEEQKITPATADDETSIHQNTSLSDNQQISNEESVTLNRVKDTHVKEPVPEEEKTTSAQAQVRSTCSAYNSISKETAYPHSAQLIEQVSNLKTRSKNELNKTYTEMLEVVSNDILFEEFKQEAKPEFGDIQQFLYEKMQDVDDETCPILITGEVSAGKSTFVNLLLGDSILPQSCLSCTSTICRIHNSETKYILATNQDNKIEKIFESIDVCSEDIQKRVSKIVSEEGRDYRYVDIYWPLAFLKKNIIIVDSPGIDPDEAALTERIYEYFPKALIFIYIINPTNGGGVQSDRLLRLHNEIAIRTLKERDGSLDINKGIFICNKWDEVREQPDVVFQVIQSKLESCWKGFKKDQLFKLSARLEIERAKSGKKISSEYSVILLAIENIIPSAVKEKIYRHIQFQHAFINRVLGSVSARILYTMTSEIENKKRIKDIYDRIACLNDKLEVVHTNILKMSEIKVDQAISNINSYLTDPNNQEAIFSWQSAKLPDPKLTDADIKVILEKIVHEHINRAIQQQLSEEMKFIIHFLNDNLSKECNTLWNECRDIEELISGPIVRTCSEINDKYTFESINNFNLGTVVNVVVHSVGAGIPSAALYALGFDGWKSVATVLLPVSLVGLAAGFIAKYTITGINYRSDKVAYAKNIADIVLKKLTQNKLEAMIKSEIMKIVQEYVKEYIDKYIPMRTLVKNLTSSQENPQVLCTQSYTVQQKAFEILGRIILSRMLIFDKNVLADDDAENITVNPEEPNLFGKEDWTLASTKSFQYSCESKEGCTELAEICCLRKINHENVLQIHGIKQISVKGVNRWHILQEVWETSLECEVFEKGIEWTTCLHYLRGSVEGLLVLHQMGLIHKNIRLRNIKIKQKMGKLSDGVVTQQTPTGIITGMPIVNAPELLQNKNVGNKVDIFSFGVIMWEAWYHKHAFFTGEEPEMLTYEELSSAIILGKRPKFNEQFPAENLQNLIKCCWSALPEERPTSIELQQLMISLFKE